MGSVYDRNKNYPERGVNLWIKYYGPAGEEVRESANTTNRAAAERLWKMREKEVAAGTWKPRKQRVPNSVAEFAAKWIAERYERGYATARDDDSRLRDHVLPVIGTKQLDCVTREDVRLLIAGVWHTQNLAPKTVHNIYGSMRAMFADAVPHSIPFTPCTLRVKKRELPVLRDKNPDWRSQALFNHDELELLLSAPYDTIPMDRLVFYAMELLGGFRFGETAGRKWLHYDRAARPLGRIACATQASRKKPEGFGLKGDGNPREIPVHPVLAEILEEWRTQGFPALFGRDPKPGDWIVPSRLGKVRSVRHMHRKMQEDLKRLGLRPRRQHDSRRTLRSLCTSAGANPKALDAITHRGSSTSTGDSAGRYDTWTWAALCEAILCLQLRVTRPRNRAQSWAHLPVPGPYLFEISSNSQRGGRGSNPKSRTPVSNSFGGFSPADAGGVAGQTPQKTDDPGSAGTLGVPEALALATDLDAAGDAIESGRAAELTPDWRVKLATACRAGADLARAQLRPADAAEVAS